MEVPVRFELTMWFDELQARLLRPLAYGTLICGHNPLRHNATFHHLSGCTNVHPFILLDNIMFVTKRTYFYVQPFTFIRKSRVRPNAVSTRNRYSPTIGGT
mgnify:CR=1 FL=1